MPIRLLSEDVASQIAAGEVVERPASVVKELLENALDAGARTITVTIEGGGRNLIRVADDGVGISAEEVELAFARHATSKLTDAQDLFHIQTLGFRGEALAAIASVSRVQCLTRAVGETAGTQLKLDGGALVGRHGLGAPQGTVISVENLFYNVPARLKFLKSETAERSHIVGLVARYAMAYPLVRFKLVTDNRTAFQSTGNGEVREVLVAVYGVDIAKQLIEINSEEKSQTQLPTAVPTEEDDIDPMGVREPRGHYVRNMIKVTGFISPPSVNRANRKDITLFVNGRWVQDVRLNAAVTQAYHTMLMVGRYPLAVITLTLPAEEVDVNVHPTKAEVRFRFPDAAFSAVERTIRKTLTERAPVPHLEVRRWDTFADAPRSWSPDWFQRNETLNPSERRDQIPNPNEMLAAQTPGEAPTSITNYQLPVTDSQSLVSNLQSPQPPLPSTAVPLLRVIGQIGAAYIVTEGPDGMYLIDQHAAHERILYEAFSVQRAAAQIVSQALLSPIAVDVPAEAATLLESQIETLRQIGFVIEPFGGNTFIVRSLPTVLGNVDPARAVRVVVEDFEEDEAPLADEVEARLIARICKRAAIKAGQVLSMTEMTRLIAQLESCRSPRTCPHGRPTMIHLSVEVLEKQFGRRG